MNAYNLFAHIPCSLPDEAVDTLASHGSTRIERIVSRGHCSPPGFWYDQQEHEWVLLMQGAARLQFDGQPDPVELRQGDYINIPAHQRHRVAWTDPDVETIWLAVFY